MEEFASKRTRLLALLRGAGLNGVLLSRPANIAWYTGGGRAYVVQSAEPGIADLLVSPDGDVVYTDEIEAERLEQEELGSLQATIKVRPWWRERDSYLPRDPLLGSDCGRFGYADASSLLRRARQELTPPEIDRYRSLGHDVAAALTETSLALAPELSEFDAAARLARALLERRIEPVLLLVAGASRLPAFRHPLPTASLLGQRMMLVAAACRGGLIASLTRLVAFTPLTSKEHHRYERLLAVEDAFLTATVPGQRLGDVFTAGVAAYAEHGFEATEWHRHHQGGPTGYLGREELVTPASEDTIVARQAFAWNPSVSGLKVEDTILAGAIQPEVLTRDGLWPTVELSGRTRPAVLEP